MKHPNLEEAQRVIRALQNEFDSHEFIQQFIHDYEKEYVRELYDRIDNENIFQSYHSSIGTFLMNNSAKLQIRKTGTVQSDNIKDNKSENAKWIKIL